MSLPPEDTSFDELTKRVKEHLRYKSMADFNRVAFPVWLLLPLLVGAFVKVLDSTEAAVLLFIGVFLSIVAVKLPEARLKDFPVEDDEWARIYSYQIVTKLELYFKTKSSGLKNKTRLEALRNATSFLYCIREKWKVGNFKLVKQSEEAVSNFKKNLAYRVIPAIRNGDDEQLRRVNHIMYNLWGYSRVLKIEDIEALNEQMSKKEDTMLSNKEPVKVNYQKMLASLKSIKFLEYVPAATILAVICVILGYVGVVYFDIDRNYAWGGSIALFGILLGAYFKVKGKTRGE
jgi:hypothetical protein